MSRFILLLGVSFLSACLGIRFEQTSTPPSPVPATTAASSAKTSPYEVFGQTYYPISVASGYRERGVASWYGGKFHGRNTANGERYDMHQFTAAHKTLPLPTWVKVTNLRNGTTATVRVNDRGPFVKNRLIDVSYAAARHLRMIDDGTTLVEVVVLDGAGSQAADPSPVPETIAPIAPEIVPTVAVETEGPIVQETADPNPPHVIHLQIGAFGELENARRMQTTLYNAGIGDVRISGGELEGIPVHRVQIGPLSSVSEYDMLITQLESLGIGDTHLVTE